MSKTFDEYWETVYGEYYGMSYEYKELAQKTWEAAFDAGYEAALNDDMKQKHFGELD